MTNLQEFAKKQPITVDELCNKGREDCINGNSDTNTARYFMFCSNYEAWYYLEQKEKK